MTLSFLYSLKVPSAPKFDIAYLNNGVLGGLVGITGDQYRFQVYMTMLSLYSLIFFLRFVFTQKNLITDSCF